jgi:hypothetical protein
MPFCCLETCPPAPVVHGCANCTAAAHHAIPTAARTCCCAAQARYGPSVIFHWEDVAASNAFGLLRSLRARNAPTFNDDIECTACATLASVLAAARLPGVPALAAQRFLLFGAGQANLGTARLLVRALQRAGLPEYQVRGRDRWPGCGWRAQEHGPRLCLQPGGPRA